MVLPDEPSRGGEPAAPARVLVVDDEESIVLTIGEVLRLEGYRVDAASSGHEAADRLASTEYDLVLTDLHMANGDGISVLENVRRLAPFTISVVLTGFASVETAISALRHGAYDYLVKPCLIDELKHVVRRGIEHRRLMIAERETRAELERLNRDLEMRVEERTAELRKVNEDLAAANRAKDVFLATLSHELRTPLTPVLGWVNLLRSGKGVDAALLAQGLDAIERNARLQTRLVDDLLDVSRVVSGKLRIEREPVDLRGVVESALDTVREAAWARRIEMSIEMPDVPVVVRGSAMRLEQIVWNLLSNAIKFTPEGGRVAVRLSSGDGECRVVVEDTGVGITNDFLPHVFDSFQQADGSTTRQFGGLGLGLAIVRALAELHDGWVRAESEGADKGARFTFALPCAQDERLRGREEKSGAHDHVESRTILIVEDSGETLELLRVLFTRAGYRVLTAASAAEALQLAQESRPGVVVSDIGMPDLDGHELLARLRRIPGLEKVPAVALSGYAQTEDRDRALAAGFSVHLAKPVDPESLMHVVRRLTA